MNTTLTYIMKDNNYLMLLRNKKVNDINKDKWIGVGGKVEFQESPDECMIREVKEETNLDVKEFKNRGLITFCFNNEEAEYMHLYTVTEYNGEITRNCPEGELKWIPISEVNDLNIWQGDKLFLDALQTDKEYFTMKLIYNNDELIVAYKNGKIVK